MKKEGEWLWVEHDKGKFARQWLDAEVVDDDWATSTPWKKLYDGEHLKIRMILTTLQFYIHRSLLR